MPLITVVSFRAIMIKRTLNMENHSFSKHSFYENKPKTKCYGFTLTAMDNLTTLTSKR